VRFFDNGVALDGPRPLAVAPDGGSGTATLPTPFSTSGTDPITAQYLPAVGSPCAGAISPVFTETITAVTSSTTLSASTTNPSLGQPVTQTLHDVDYNTGTAPRARSPRPPSARTMQVGSLPAGPLSGH
jgi:hypothetical protein